MKNRFIFFRNDDVRETLDNSLILVTEVCVNNKIPISHAIEPANVTKEVVDWLLKTKKQNTRLIEIVQHGYKHELNYKRIIGGKLKKGEFGGNRSYEEQYAEIRQGMDLMDKYFGEYWFPLFTFPYGARNYSTLRAIRDAGFKVVNGSMGITLQHKLLYFVGRFLNREMLFNRKISYNLRYRKVLGLFQIDTSFSVIKHYINEESEALFYSLDELKKKTIEYLKNSTNLGIVLHHRYHNTPAKIKLLKDYINWVKSLDGVSFVTQEFIYRKFSAK